MIDKLAEPKVIFGLLKLKTCQNFYLSTDLGKSENHFLFSINHNFAVQGQP